MHFKFSIFLVFLLAICLFCIAVPIHATTISPLLIELSIDPGQSGQGKVKLLNEGNEDLYISGHIEAFKPKGEHGETELVSLDINYQAINWVSLPVSSLVLSPGEMKEVPIIIDVPKTADVGGYYLVSMWKTGSGPKINNNQLAISSQVGALILLEVKGEVNENMEILEFGILDNRKFFSHLPIDFNFRLENKGNVHTKPLGKIVIKNIFGLVDDIILINQEKRNVLPKSIRQFENIWGNEKDKKGFLKGLKNEWQPFKFGKYNAILNIEYGRSKNNISSEEISFWVIPWRTIIIFLVILILVLIFKKAIKIKKKTV